MNNKLAIESYIQKIDYWLTYSKERKIKVLKRLRSDIEEAIQDKGVSDPVIAFGDPYQVAKDLSRSQDWATKRVSYTKRAFAFFIDLLIQTAGSVIGFGIWFNSLDPNQEILGIISLFVFLVPYVLFWLFGYFVLFEKLIGATPGKVIFGLLVCDESGIRINWTQAIIRNLTKSQVFILPLEVLLGQFQKTDRQRPLDVVAKTIVVRKE
ncbi:MAG: RDD family protein [Candidatus Hermodarchaeota archaeon]